MIIKNTLWLLGSFITGRVIISFWQLYLARRFVHSTDIYGYYMLLLTQYSVWILLAEGSITYAVQQFIAEDRERTDFYVSEYWPFVIGARFFLGIVTAVVFAILMGTKYPLLRMPITILSLTLLLYAAGTAPLGLWAGIGNFKPEAKSSMILTIVFITMALVVISFSRNLTLLISCSLLSVVVQGTYIWSVSLQKWGLPHNILTSLKRHARKFARFCLPVLFAAFIFRFFYKGDMMVITSELGPEKAGIYGIALMFFFLIADLLWGQFGKAYTPELIASWSKREGQSNTVEQVQQIFSVYALVNILAVLVLTFAGKPLMSMLFGRGSPWVEAATPLFWLLMGFFPVIMYAVSYRILLCEKGSKPYLVASVFVVLLKLAIIRFYTGTLSLEGIGALNSVLMLMFGVILTMTLSPAGKKMFWGVKTIFGKMLPVVSIGLLAWFHISYGLSAGICIPMFVVMLSGFIILNKKELMSVLSIILPGTVKRERLFSRIMQKLRRLFIQKFGYKPAIFWNIWALNFDKDEEQVTFHPWNQIALDIIKGYKSESILEIGCGFGRNIKRFIDAGFPQENIYGVDISQRMLNKCRRKLFPNKVNLERADIRVLPFSDGSIDVVYVSLVLMHVPPKTVMEAVSEAIRVARSHIVFLELFQPSADFGGSQKVNKYTFAHDYPTCISKTGYRINRFQVMDKWCIFEVNK